MLNVVDSQTENKIGRLFGKHNNNREAAKIDEGVSPFISRVVI